MNSLLRHSIIDLITMMLDTQTFVPRYFQFKLHCEAQISSGVPAPRVLLCHAEQAPEANHSVF